MHKKLKNLIRNTKEIFSQEFLDKIARKTGFIKRNGNREQECTLKKKDHHTLYI